MSFTFTPATRDRIGLLIGVAGASGSGKTYSALLLARALAGDAPIAVIDTEARRAKHYADKFKFLHGDFEPPFTPERYVEAVKAAEEAGAGVIVIDSASHEWAGEGGCADIQAAEAERMAKDKDGNVIAWKIEAMTAPAWKKPKIRHKRMMSRFVQSRSHLIFCLRADEKVKFVKEKDDRGRERTQIVPIGFQPICERGFMYEMTLSLTLHPETPGQVRYDLPHKLNDDLQGIFSDGALITEKTGATLREWAERGADNRLSAAEQKIADGVRDLIERIEDCGDNKALQALIGAPDTAKRREWLKANRPPLSDRLESSISDAVSRLSAPPPDDGWPGPDTSQMQSAA